MSLPSTRLWAVLALLLSARARASTDAASPLLVEQAPTDWFGELRSAVRDWQPLLADWSAEERRMGGTAFERSYLESLQGLQTAQLDVYNSRSESLKKRVVDLEARVATATGDLTVAETEAWRHRAVYETRAIESRSWRSHADTLLRSVRATAQGVRPGEEAFFEEDDLKQVPPDPWLAHVDHVLDQLEQSRRDAACTPEAPDSVSVVHELVKPPLDAGPTEVAPTRLDLDLTQLLRALESEEASCTAFLRAPTPAPDEKAMTMSVLDFVELSESLSDARVAAEMNANGIIELEGSLIDIHERLAGLPAPDPSLIKRVQTLAEEFQLLDARLDVLQARVPDQDLCQLLVIGGLSEWLASSSSRRGLLVRAAAAHGGVCEPVFRDFSTVGAARLAWTQAATEAARKGNARISFDPGLRWTIDGLELSVPANRWWQPIAGEHRVEVWSNGVLLRAETVSFPHHGAYYVLANRQAIELVPGEEALSDPDWVAYYERLPPEPKRDEIARTYTPSVAPRDPHLSLGVVAGATWSHARLWAALGPTFLLEPGWRSHLGFEGSYLLESAHDPVYISRWEPIPFVTRGALALRWTPVATRGFTWGISAGAFAEPSIAVGPWLSTRAAFHLEKSVIDLSLSSPLYIEDKLGHVGAELLVSVRSLHRLTRPTLKSPSSPEL